MLCYDSVRNQCNNSIWVTNTVSVTKLNLRVYWRGRWYFTQNWSLLLPVIDFIHSLTFTSHAYKPHDVYAEVLWPELCEILGTMKACYWGLSTYLGLFLMSNFFSFFVWDLWDLGCLGCTQCPVLSLVFSLFSVFLLYGYLNEATSVMLCRVNTSFL